MITCGNDKKIKFISRKIDETLVYRDDEKEEEERGHCVQLCIAFSVYMSLYVTDVYLEGRKH